MPTPGPHVLGSPTSRLPTLPFAVAIIFPVLAALAPYASAVSAEILLGGHRVGEYQAVRGKDFLAWQQNTRERPGHYDVFARPIGGGTAFRVNAAGTNGANGGIEGDLLVYPEFGGGASDLKFFDLASKDRSPPPRGINTREWEYWPSISGQWILFGRLAGNGAREIILYDLSTRDATTLAQLRGT